MKIHEILDRDPRSSPLANGGQARITTSQNEAALCELRAELETFVCDGQYGDAIERILAGYLRQLDRPRQDAAWVSGFFGSGKSHLLKMLGHLWIDTAFADGSTARSLVHELPDEVTAHLRELDMRVARTGKPAVAAAGSLLSGSSDHVRLTVLAVVLRACGLPEQYPLAEFCFWLRERGLLDRVRGAVESAGKDWHNELRRMNAGPLVAQTLLECDSSFAKDLTEARAVLRREFPPRTSDITTAEFLDAMRKALAPKGELPLTIVVLDEVQQFIGDSTDRAVTITEIAEAVQTQLDSRVMLVASGQSALSSMPQLLKLRDRFRVLVQLSDTDVEAVTRKVLLRKRPSAVDAIRNVLERNAGEVSRQLQSTRLAERAEDRATIVEDYPLLPTRRRFWEESFKRLDAAGTRSQLRSQLQIVHAALQGLATKDLGAVIPADALFQAISTDLVNTNVLMSEIANRIQAQDDGTDRGRLRQRICGLVFVINKLPREAVVDTGLRSTPRTIADLLVDDLGHDSGPLRQEVETALEALAADAVLMKLGEEYRIQTTDGAEWDRAFREKVAALRGQEPEYALKRDQILARQVQSVLGELKLLHGESKLRRTLHLHTGLQDPAKDAGDIAVWLRDSASIGQKDVENEARKRGPDDPVVHVFLRKSPEDLRTRIVEAEAARAVIDAKGGISSKEGLEARESMQSRLASAESERDALVRDLVGAAYVYQGGGNAVFGEPLRQRLEIATQASLARLFPRFAEADARAAAWETVRKRAVEGSEQPLVPVGWDKASEDHPVVRQVLTQIGASARGGDVRKALEAPPYGWPRDAIDAGLLVLHRAGTVRATVNGQPTAAGQLDQAKLQVAEFRPEKVRLGTTEKIALRGLYQLAGVSVKPGEEELKAPMFLEALLTLAREAGGDAPLPARPDTTKIEDLKRLAGSEQLGALHLAKTDIEGWIAAWSARKKRVEERRPGWEKLQRLARHAADLAVAVEVAPEIEAIATNRALLADTDHVAPLCAKLAKALRASVTEKSDALRQAFDAGMSMLEGDSSWNAIQPTVREEILRSEGLAQPAAPSIKSDDDLQRELDRESLSARTSAAAACPERARRALAEAARRSKPTARRVSMRTATLSNEAEVRAWLVEAEGSLLDALKSGPVIVS